MRKKKRKNPTNRSLDYDYSANRADLDFSTQKALKFLFGIFGTGLRLVGGLFLITIAILREIYKNLVKVRHKLTEDFIKDIRGYMKRIREQVDKIDNFLEKESNSDRKDK